MVLLLLPILGLAGIIAAVLLPVSKRRRGSCTKCGYDLRGLSVQGHCPECGTPFDTLRPLTARDVRPVRSLWAAAVVLAAGTAVALLAAPWKSNSSFVWFVVFLQFVPFAVLSSVLAALAARASFLAVCLLAVPGFVAAVLGLVPSYLYWDKDAQGGLHLIFGWLISGGLMGTALGIASLVVRFLK